jgi:hypothetical protein
MIVEVVLIVAAIYLGCGLIFAIPFILKGVTVIDEVAVGSRIGFRIIIIPGVVVFWPLLLKKWMQTKSTRHDETA